VVEMIDPETLASLRPCVLASLRSQVEACITQLWHFRPGFVGPGWATGWFV